MTKTELSENETKKLKEFMHDHSLLILHLEGAKDYDYLFSFYKEQYLIIHYEFHDYENTKKNRSSSEIIKIMAQALANELT